MMLSRPNSGELPGGSFSMIGESRARDFLLVKSVGKSCFIDDRPRAVLTIYAPGFMRLNTSALSRRSLAAGLFRDDRRGSLALDLSLFLGLCLLWFDGQCRRTAHCTFEKISTSDRGILGLRHAHLALVLEVGVEPTCPVKGAGF